MKRVATHVPLCVVYKWSSLALHFLQLWLHLTPPLVDVKSFWHDIEVLAQWAIEHVYVQLVSLLGPNSNIHVTLDLMFWFLSPLLITYWNVSLPKVLIEKLHSFTSLHF
jgi:hypothetical protein